MHVLELGLDFPFSGSGILLDAFMEKWCYPGISLMVFGCCNSPRLLHGFGLPVSRGSWSCCPLRMSKIKADDLSQGVLMYFWPDVICLTLILALANSNTCMNQSWTKTRIMELGKKRCLKTPMSGDVLAQYVCFNSPWIGITCHRAWKQAFVLETTNSFTSKAHTPGLTFFSHSNSTLHHWQGTRASVEACCHICSTWGFFGFLLLQLCGLAPLLLDLLNLGFSFCCMP